MDIVEQNGRVSLLPQTMRHSRGIGSMRGAVSFRLLLLMLLLATALLPLVTSMSLNLPYVINVLESSLEENQIFRLKGKLLEVENIVTRRAEGVQILTHLPGARIITSGHAERGIDPEFVYKRLSRMLREMFNHHKDIKKIIVLDIDGRELYKIKRIKGNGLEPAKADELKTLKDAARKIKELDGKDNEISVLSIDSQPSSREKDHHVQHFEITLGSPVYGYDGRLAGAAAMTFDITDILGGVQFNFLASGAGDFLSLEGTYKNGHASEPGAAFRIFPGLSDLVRTGKADLLSGVDGRRVVWAPMISTQDPEQSMWCGAPVDYSAARGIVRTIIRRVILMGTVIMLVMILVARRLSDIADRFRQELVQALEDLLRNNSPTRLRWKRPAEIREMCQAINELSQSYRLAMHERRRVEENLRILNRRLNLILENAAEGILELDSACLIEYANSAACRMLGFSREELLGNDLHSLVHYLRKDRSQYPQAECPFCNALERGEYKLFREDTLWRKNGEPVDVEYLTAPILDDGGKVIGMVMCIRDITERREAKKKEENLRTQLLQSQKMEAVGTLAGGVAHEFNNLLTAITGYSELLAQELKDDPRAINRLKSLLDAAMRASELTKQLLSFSRKQTPRMKVVRINELVRKQQKMLGRLIGENIELEAVLDSDENIRVLADPGMIEQVLVNLIVNARDAMPEGGRITLRTGRKILEHRHGSMKDGHGPGPYACICVEDTGIGIQEEDLKKIFTPFFTTKPPQKGTGLGLSVVWGIIEQHNGWINVESKPGKGTVFSVYLPEYSGNGVNAYAEPKTESTDVSGQGRRVLLLEDEEMVRNIAREILQTYGFDVICAENIEEAKLKFGANASDIQLVFSDVVLPDGNGVDFAKWVREQAPEMPVVLASGYTGTNGLMKEIRNMGLTFLQKPFKLHRLITAIDTAMKDKTNT